MKIIDIRCPSCGHPSHLTDSHTYSRASVGVKFKCANTSCRIEFGGVVTLATGLLPGVESFAADHHGSNTFGKGKDAKKKWIGVDFDGTLAEQHSNGRMGDPIVSMVARVKQWQKDGIEVRIFTARSHDPDQVEDLRNWLRRHQLPDLPITNLKDPNLMQLWDDKAVRVQHNTGKPCSGCDPKGKHSAHSAAPVFNAAGHELTDY